MITNAEANRRGNARNRDQDTENYLFALDKFCEPKTVTKEEFRTRFPDKKQWHREVSLFDSPYAPFRRFKGHNALVPHALARRQFIQACDRLRHTRTGSETAPKLHLENVRHRLPGHGIKHGEFT